jgi:uncharacterized membrane protein YcjF (UPF0283 family)
LRAEAADEESLRRLQDLVAHRLETIGRRDRLKVTWERSEAPETEEPDQAIGASPAHTGHAAAHRGRHTKIALIAVGALVVAIHLGLLGTAFASSRWTKWGADIILLIVVVKLVVVPTKIVVLRRLAVRRRERRATPFGSAAADEAPDGELHGTAAEKLGQKAGEGSR